MSRKTIYFTSFFPNRDAPSIVRFSVALLKTRVLITTWENISLDLALTSSRSTFISQTRRLSCFAFKYFDNPGKLPFFFYRILSRMILRKRSSCKLYYDHDLLTTSLFRRRHARFSFPREIYSRRGS